MDYFGPLNRGTWVLTNVLTVGSEKKEQILRVLHINNCKDWSYRHLPCKVSSNSGHLLTLELTLEISWPGLTYILFNTLGKISIHKANILKDLHL